MVTLKGQILDKRTGKIYSEVECSEDNLKYFEVVEGGTYDS